MLTNGKKCSTQPRWLYLLYLEYNEKSELLYLVMVFVDEIQKSEAGS